MKMILGILAVLMTVLAQSPAQGYDRPRGECHSAASHRAHWGEVPAVADPDRWLGSRSRHRPPTLMVGDSITAGSWRELKGRLHERWEITAVPGRDVATLPCYIADRLKSKAPLRRVVIALGTNATSWWTYADYAAAVKMLPRSTKVVLVTTYRAPVPDASSLPVRVQPGMQFWYSRWMRHIADTRPGTCLARWRGYVESRPWAVHDGVHPSVAGKSAWAKVVKAAAHKKACRI